MSDMLWLQLDASDYIGFLITQIHNQTNIILYTNSNFTSNLLNTNKLINLCS